MTNTKKTNKTRENTSGATPAVERDWAALKPGDEVLFNGEWNEVFDAFPNGRNTVVVKLLDAAGEIETHHIRIATAGKATCRG